MTILEVNTEKTTTMTRAGMSGRRTWSAVGSMALCVSLLIASEFMPVSLLTPIAKDMNASQGATGQAISVSGLFAVISSSLIATIAGRFDRRHVLTALTAVMLISLMLMATAPNFLVFMASRALLGIVIGGFWSLATATVMRLVPAANVPKALGHGQRLCYCLCCSDRKLFRRDHRLARSFLGACAHNARESDLAVA